MTSAVLDLARQVVRRRLGLGSDASLGTGQFDAAYAQGRTLSFDDAIALALGPVIRAAA